MKVTKEQRELALEYCEKLELDVIFVNEKGEMFSDENSASLSVEGKKDKYTKVEAYPLEEVPSDDPQEEEDEELEDLLAEIELTEDASWLENLVKNDQRQVVITASKTRLSELSNE